MIDWTIFDRYPENTVYCQCETVYRSHTKAAIGADGQFHIYCRKPCPVCRSDIDPRRASSDVEVMTLGKKDT